MPAALWNGSLMIKFNTVYNIKMQLKFRSLPKGHAIRFLQITKLFHSWEMLISEKCWIYREYIISKLQWKRILASYTYLKSRIASQVGRKLHPVTRHDKIQSLSKGPFKVFPTPITDEALWLKRRILLYSLDNKCNLLYFVASKHSQSKQVPEALSKSLSYFFWVTFTRSCILKAMNTWLSNVSVTSSSHSCTVKLSQHKP